MITLKVRCSQCGAPVRKSDLVNHQVWPKSVIIAIISYNCRHLLSMQQNIITTIMHNHWIICEFFLKFLHVTAFFSTSTTCDALDIMYGWCHTTHSHHLWKQHERHRKRLMTTMLKDAKICGDSKMKETNGLQLSVANMSVLPCATFERDWCWKCNIHLNKKEEFRTTACL